MKKKLKLAVPHLRIWWAKRKAARILNDLKYVQASCDRGDLMLGEHSRVFGDLRRELDTTLAKLKKMDPSYPVE